MKYIVTLYTALLLAPLAMQAQQSTSIVRDHLWIFTVYAGGSNRETQAFPAGNTTHYIDGYSSIKVK